MAEVHERSGRGTRERRAGNDGRRRPEEPADRNQPAGGNQPAERNQGADRNQPAEGKPRQIRVNPAVVGACLAGLVLVAYFVWLSIEMGGHSVAGGAPMVAVFMASALGVGAGGLGLLIGRRRD